MSENKQFFIADTHFGHKNILRLNNRPFETLEEMEDTIIRNWNSRVQSEDEVYILGDFWYKGGNNSVNYLRKLKGKKHLIQGNHDIKSLKNEEFINSFESISDIKEIRIGNELVVICHYPLLEWNGYFRGAYHIHGHIHNNKNGAYQHLKEEERALNAGVDIIGFKPVTFEELKVINKEWKILN